MQSGWYFEAGFKGQGKKWVEVMIDHLQQSTLTAKSRKEEKKEAEGEKDKTEASSAPVGT